MAAPLGAEEKHVGVGAQLDSARVATLPTCEMCNMLPAQYDAKSEILQIWSYMCTYCWQQHSCGMLGLGFGQRLIVAPPVATNTEMGHEHDVIDVCLQDTVLKFCTSCRVILCGSCESKPRSVVTLPCGHLHLCSACSVGVSECPRCGASVTEALLGVKI